MVWTCPHTAAFKRFASDQPGAAKRDLQDALGIRSFPHLFESSRCCPICCRICCKTVDTRGVTRTTVAHELADFVLA